MMGYDWCKKKNCVPDPNNLEKTHVLLGTTSIKYLGELYERMQGSYWSPNGEARSLIRSKGLGHTSMSIGDIVKIDDQVWFIDGVGWIDLTSTKRYPEFENEVQKDSVEQNEVHLDGEEV
jgi:hypothetical protein